VTGGRAPLDADWQIALLRVHGSEGAGPPPHYHAGEEETFYLLEGEMTFYAGGEEIHAVPGDTVIVPRGLEHTFRNDTTEVKFLMQVTPAGFERYFQDMSEPAEYLGLPANPGPPDIARMVATATRYGTVFTAPKP
jgi:quercetin dioxygenase-like cupin family protein